MSRVKKLFSLTLARCSRVTEESARTSSNSMEPPRLPLSLYFFFLFSPHPWRSLWHYYATWFRIGASCLRLFAIEISGIPVQRGPRRPPLIFEETPQCVLGLTGRRAGFLDVVHSSSGLFRRRIDSSRLCRCAGSVVVMLYSHNRSKKKFYFYFRYVFFNGNSYLARNLLSTSHIYVTKNSRTYQKIFRERCQISKLLRRSRERSFNVFFLIPKPSLFDSGCYI